MHKHLKTGAPQQLEAQTTEGLDIKNRSLRAAQLSPIPVLHLLPSAKEASAAQELFAKRTTDYLFIEKAATPENAFLFLSRSKFEIVLLDEALPASLGPRFWQGIWNAAAPPVVIVTRQPIEVPFSDSSISIGGQFFLIKGEVDEALLVEAVIYTQSRKEIRRELRHLQDDLRRTNHELESAHLQLIQAEKLDALGQLAAGIAHEVKNPLARILLGVEYLDRADLANDQNLPTVFDQIKKAARLADNLVRGMVDFSSSSKLNLEKGNLNILVKNAALMIQHELTVHSVDPLFDLDDDLPQIDMDTAKLEQVLLNLYLNAIHAMEGEPGCELRISTAAEEIAEPDPSPSAGLRLGPGDPAAVIRIEDEGPGISDDDLPHVFEPFFTTRKSGKGTGLGLAVCKKIIDLHQGLISIENRPRAGVMATIKLPIAVAAKE